MAPAPQASAHGLSSFFRRLSDICLRCISLLSPAAGLIGLYAPQALSALAALASLPQCLDFLSQGTTYAFLPGLGMILTLVWGADAVRGIAKYGIGTGVPSVSMYAIGLGVISALFGLAVGGRAGPPAGLLCAAILGAAAGFSTNRILGMNIPLFERRMAEISVAGMLSFTLSAMIVSGSASYADFLENSLLTGFSSLSFMGCALITFHAYNANLGADESLDRTRMLAFADGGGLAVLMGFLSLARLLAMPADSAPFSPAGPAAVILTGLIVLAGSFRSYLALVRRDAYAVIDTGLLPAEEELQ